jgi:hypothetical protein
MVETLSLRTGSGDPTDHAKFVEPLRELYEQVVGRTLDSSNFATPSHNQINISGLMPGIYFIHFQTSEGIRIQKFIRK